MAAIGRVNQIIQLYNSSLRDYVTWRIVEEGMQRDYKLE
jgi:hypothetical protein